MSGDDCFPVEKQKPPRRRPPQHQTFQPLAPPLKKSVRTLKSQRSTPMQWLKNFCESVGLFALARRPALCKVERLFGNRIEIPPPRGTWHAARETLGANAPKHSRSLPFSNGAAGQSAQVHADVPICPQMSAESKCAAELGEASHSRCPHLSRNVIAVQIILSTCRSVDRAS
jgi:hypothetical protein